MSTTESGQSPDRHFQTKPRPPWEAPAALPGNPAQSFSIPDTTDRQLGVDLRKHRPTTEANVQIIEGILRDLMGQDVSILPPLLHLAGLPALLRLDPDQMTHGERLLARDHLISELELVYHPLVLKRLNSFLEGYLDLNSAGGKIAKATAFAPLNPTPTSLQLDRNDFINATARHASATRSGCEARPTSAEGFSFPECKGPHQSWEATLTRSRAWQLLPKQQRSTHLAKARRLDNREDKEKDGMLATTPVEPPGETPFVIPEGMTPEEATIQKIKRDAETWPVIITWTRSDAGAAPRRPRSC